MAHTAPSSAVLRTDHLTKRYKEITAVDQISFEVHPGRIVGLLGPNGAGKSTTINMILGILEPTSGTIEVFGKNAVTHRHEISSQVNFAAVYAHVPPNLTVRQNLEIFGRLYGVRPIKERVASLLHEFDLEQFASTRSGLLSSGESSRLNLAKAVINSPRLLLLDEPTASLDPHVAQVVREKIKTYVDRSRTAVLWTSHNMREIEAICDYVLFLSHGKILLEGNPQTLPMEYKKADLEELFIAVAREPLSLKD